MFTVYRNVSCKFNCKDEHIGYTVNGGLHLVAKDVVCGEKIAKNEAVNDVY